MKRNLKIIYSGRLLTGMILLPFGSALAIDPPEDDAKPPAALRKKEENRSGSNIPNSLQEGIPFIGIATASLPEMVSDHLGIEPGAGVIIRTIQPESSASKAGLAIHDIILKIGEEPVRSPEELSSLIRSKNIGDPVVFKIIHRGERTDIKVTVGERPPGRVAGFDQAPMLEGLPEGDAIRLRDLIERNLQSFGNRNRNRNPGLGNHLPPNDEFEKTFREMRDRLNQRSGELPQLDGAGGGIMRLESSSTVRMMDSEGSVEIKTSGDETEAIVRDRSNEIVWSGPWNSEEDKAAAPEGVRSRIDRANSTTEGSFSLRFRSLIPSPDSIEN
jgi:hypothetical protein